MRATLARALSRFFEPFFFFLDGLKGLEQVYYMESKMSSESAWEGVPLHPGPQTRNAPSIPVSEDRGFTARLDKRTGRPQGYTPPIRSCIRRSVSLRSPA